MNYSLSKDKKSIKYIKLIENNLFFLVIIFYHMRFVTPHIKEAVFLITISNLKATKLD